MRSLRNLANKIWDKLLIATGILFVLLPTSPLNMPFADRDSGVFLYIGWRILNNELPYRDIWDHKPPIIFYINALGLFILHSRWGVWLIEFFALFAAAILSFQLIKKVFDSFSSALGLSLWLITLAILIGGGNLTTEYTLPLQFAALWLVYNTDATKFQNLRHFLIGLTGAIAFFTKQTTIGIWIAIILYITLRICTSYQEGKYWLRKILFIISGGLLVSLIIVIFFYLQGALPQFWDAAFRYNFVYSFSTNDFVSRLAPVATGIILLAKTGLLEFSVVGYILALFLIRKNAIPKTSHLIIVGLIDLPIELILVSASGRTYPHYYLTLLPCLALFSAIPFWFLYSHIPKRKISISARYILSTNIFFIFLLISLGAYKTTVIGYRNIGNEAAINYIKSSTTPDSYVLLWGAESDVNFFTQRRCPSRFVYQYPLYTQGYVDEQMIEEFLQDTIRIRPAVIIDTKNPTTPLYDFPIHTKAINANIAYLKSHYLAAGEVGGWTVYEYIGNP